MNVLETAKELLEKMVNHFSVDLVVTVIEQGSKCITRAVFHLNHDIEGDEILLFFDQLIERIVGLNSYVT